VERDKEGKQKVPSSGREEERVSTRAEERGGGGTAPGCHDLSIQSSEKLLTGCQ